ncbi:MAG: helix-turn-helix domain-containing protein [Bacteroidaceae bacterium]|nr:helix-turn-helix domain-containing protein [Bacteroidaceae bacterium]
MTSQEKQRIAVMRSNGMSYNAIATELGIPVNSVKTFCRRNSLGGVRAIENLSGDEEQTGLIDGENRGNSTIALGLESPEIARIPVSQQAKVKLVFSETSDDDAITDVLGMLMWSHYRQG